MSDLELQIELAKMIPEKIYGGVSFPFYWIVDKIPRDLIRDTEWLHACWLIRVKHMMPLHVGSQEPWQEQAEHILNYTR